MSALLKNPRHSVLHPLSGKTFLSFLSLIIIFLITSACSDSTGPEENIISFKTDADLYAQSDTMIVILKNNTSEDYLYFLRCGGYLEMFFQKQEKGAWSDNKWFWFMSLRCPTVIDTLKPGDSFKYALPAEWFKDSGVFRLIIGDLHSNSFKISE